MNAFLTKMRSTLATGQMALGGVLPLRLKSGCFDALAVWRRSFGDDEIDSLMAPAIKSTRALQMAGARITLVEN
jgi:hypothetical protein